MKVIAYNLRANEKEYLAKANQKKHEITLISNPLSLDTAGYAQGKDAVIIDDGDDLSAPVIAVLAQKGIRFITTRSAFTSNIDINAAQQHRIKLASVNDLTTPQDVAQQTIINLDNWQQNKCVGNACICARNCQPKV
jgi:lactate dehydrogenase-like 2-hydroxyacid dehydrogenase